MDGYLEPVKSPTPQSVEVNGSFGGNGTSDPLEWRGEGIASITRKGVGDYEIKLAGRYASLICATGGVQLATPLARTVLFNTETIGLTADNTIRLLVRDKTDAAVETALNANNRIHFRLTLCNTINPGI